MVDIFDTGGMLNPSTGAFMPGAGYGYGAMPYGGMLPETGMLYRMDPRRDLVMSLLAQGQGELNQPTYSKGAALAKALTIGLGGLGSAALTRDYEDMNKGAMADRTAAFTALAGKPAGAGTTAVDGTPSDAIAPDPEAAIRILSRNPANMQLAWQLEQGNLGFQRKLAESGKTITPAGTMAALPGAAETTQTLAQAQSGGSEAGKSAVDLQYQPQIKRATDIAETGPLLQRHAGEKSIDVAAEKNVQQFKDDGEPITYKLGGVEYTSTKGALRSWAARNNQSVPGIWPPVPGAGTAPPATPPAGPGNGEPAPGPSIGTIQTPPPEKPEIPGQSGPAAAAGGAPRATPAAAVVPPPPAPASPAAAPGAPVARGPASGPPTIGIGTPANTQVFEPLIGEDSKEVATNRQAALQGQQDLRNVTAITDLLGKTRMGWGAEDILEGARVLKTLGVSDDALKQFTNTSPADAQALQKVFLQLSAGAVRQMGAREPGSVIQLFSKAYPNLETDPGAAQLMTNVLRMDAVRRQRLADQETTHLVGALNDLRTSGQYKGLQGFNEAFNKANDPEMYMRAAEAMSSRMDAWQKTDPKRWDELIGLMPNGTHYIGPDGQLHVRGLRAQGS